MSARQLSSICNEKNQLRMLGTIKLQARLNHTRVVPKFIVWDTLVASAIIGADFCDQHVMEIRPKQSLAEKYSGDFISVVHKPCGQMKAQPSLPDGLTSQKENPWPTPVPLIAEKTTLPTHSQRRILVQTPWASTAVVQPYTSLYKKTSTAAANKVIGVKPNVPLKVLIPNTGRKVQELVKSEWVATMVPHPTRIVFMAIGAAEILDLSTDASQEKVEP